MVGRSPQRFKRNSKRGQSREGFREGSGKSKKRSSVLKPPQFWHPSGHLSGTNFSKEWKTDGIECSIKRRWGRRDRRYRHSFKTRDLRNLTQRTRKSGRDERGLDTISSDCSLLENSTQHHKAVAQPGSPCTSVYQEMQTLSIPTHSWPNYIKAIHLERTNVTRAVFHGCTHPFIYLLACNSELTCSNRLHHSNPVQ